MASFVEEVFDDDDVSSEDADGWDVDGVSSRSFPSAMLVDEVVPDAALKDVVEDDDPSEEVESEDEDDGAADMRGDRAINEEVRW